MADSKEVLSQVNRFLHQVDGQDSLTNVCFRASQIALGNNSITPYDCNPKLRPDHRRHSSISGELGKNKQYIASREVLDKDTSLQAVTEAFQHPRQSVETQGYQQPTRVNGTLVLLTPEKQSQNKAHAFAVLPTNILPRNSMRQARNHQAPHLVVDTTQEPPVFATSTQKLATYIKDWIDLGYEVEVQVIGQDKPSRSKLKRF